MKTAILRKLLIFYIIFTTSLSTGEFFVFVPLVSAEEIAVLQTDSVVSQDQTSAVTIPEESSGDLSAAENQPTAEPPSVETTQEASESVPENITAEAPEIDASPEAATETPTDSPAELSPVENQPAVEPQLNTDENNSDVSDATEELSSPEAISTPQSDGTVLDTTTDDSVVPEEPTATPPVSDEPSFEVTGEQPTELATTMDSVATTVETIPTPSVSGEASAEATEEQPIAEEVGPPLSDNSTWIINYDGSVTTAQNVTLGVIYYYPKNEDLSIKFTLLPENSGTITIREIKLGPQEQEILGALSDTAYDITATMEDGTFAYDLTLPLPEDVDNLDVKVNYAETAEELFEDIGIEHPDEQTQDNVTIKNLDHLTIFVVTKANPPLAGQACIDAGASGADRCFNSISGAIAAASNNDTINVSAGTYQEKLNLGGKTLTIEGAGADTTIVDASSLTGYAIQNFGNSSAIRGLTLKGTTDSYGFKVSGVENITLENIKVENSKKTGVDLNGVNGATLTNIEVVNTISGFGVMVFNSSNATITDVKTSGNAWAGVSVQNKGQTVNNVVFNGNFDASENAALLIEQDPDSVGNYYDLTNIQIPSKFNYVVYDFRNGDNYKQKYYFETLDSAKTFAQGVLTSTSPTYKDELIYDVAESNYYVIQGMKIQDAITAATAGDTINVAAGTYSERIVINKPLTLRGATYGLDKNGYAVPANYAWDAAVESIINNPEPALSTSNLVDIVSDDVIFEGFIVQSLNALPSGANDQLLRLDATTGSANDGAVADETLDNIIIRNNVIGPNTNITSQNGTNGRMGLYFASPTYASDEKGITNTLITGNKIFNCQGNGNNIFVWGAAENYSSPENADYSGTIIEGNEIYGSHRSGIEIAGGVDGLEIKDNKIYDNSGLVTDNPNDLKYGNGIVMIRMGSDKNSPTAMGSVSVTIEGNEIYDNEKNGIYLGPINSSHLIKDNNMHDNGWDAVRIDLEENYHAGSVDVYDKTSNISLSTNKLLNNGQGVKVIGTSTNGFVLDAAKNYWGTAKKSSIQPKISGTVTFEPYYVDAAMTVLNTEAANTFFVDATYTDGNAGGHTYAYDAFSKIQDAIDNASTTAMTTIRVAAGTYNENITLNKHVKIIGSGSSNTIIQGNTDVHVFNVTTSGTAENPILIKDLKIETKNAPAIDIPNGTAVQHLKLDNLRIAGPSVLANNNNVADSGLIVQSSASLSDLDVRNCVFENLAYGINFQKTGIADQATYASDINVIDTQFNNNRVKGVYAEKLSDATFTRVTFNGNGKTNIPAWALPNNIGFDVNLKYGDYQNIVLNNLSVTGNGLGSKEGCGLAIKARGTGTDTSYSARPATLDNVQINGGTFTGNERGIRIGEPGKSNTGPTNVVVRNAKISGNTKTYSGTDGSAYGDLVNLSQADVNAEENWWETASSTEITAKVSGSVDFDPWYTNAAKTILSDSTHTDASYSSTKTGQADVTDTNVVLDDDTKLDLSDGLSSSSDGIITVGGEEKDLNDFTSNELVGIDLTTPQTVGDAITTVDKAVKLASANAGEDIKLTNADLSNVSVAIPDGTTVLAPAAWDGKITPPKTSSGATGNAPSGFSVGDTKIEVGSSDGVLLFDKAVKITLVGVTGTVGYKPAGSDNWKVISTKCNSETDYSNISFPNECYYPVGNDTVIWTYHFTAFGSLTQTPVSPAVSGGGGGGGVILGVYNPPTQPDGGFGILINNGAGETNSLNVTLTFQSGSDTRAVWLSESPDFPERRQTSYDPAWGQVSVPFSLSGGEATKTVYAKFCTQWGQCSGVVSDSIVYKKEIIMPLVNIVETSPQTPEVSPQTPQAPTQPIQPAAQPQSSVEKTTPEIPAVSESTTKPTYAQGADVGGFLQVLLRNQGTSVYLAGINSVISNISKPVESVVKGVKSIGQSIRLMIKRILGR